MNSVLLSVAVLALVGWNSAQIPFPRGTCSAAKPGIPADIAVQREAALQNGNEFRRRHGAKPLTVDSTLEAEAQKYAELLASRRTFVRGPQPGQNLIGIPCDNGSKLYPSDPSIPSANVHWYGDFPPYCHNPATAYVPVGAPLGNFATMVWKASEKVGYGAAVASNGLIIIVARYFPEATADPAAVQKNVQCERIP
ncbi:Golgi-associated plant pathogenesis-related protein 1-like [Folsomia candida]|uniref:Golgi-associated plant pathogenesis-related protein 1 n=1 Tax=Folsomia candida TaxID=158441 RepID=A0A226DTX3_FOLCA|nr:Golgi-associated plant pathogenesis-related protein 1-like [Folsomia candida]OXA48468.1 Golgi-associated plant pathogenesis-related protein 1 [Folsomia candida]